VTSDATQPSEQESRRLLSEELSKPEYNRPDDLFNRALEWLFEQLGDLLEVLPGTGGLSAVLIGSVVAVAVAASLFAARGRLRSSALKAGSSGAVLEEAHLRAHDYRERAERARTARDWNAVLLDSYRALTASAGERTLLDDTAARTAHEVAASLSPVFPGYAQALFNAAAGFDRVRYGQLDCDEQDALAVAELDRSLMQTRPVHDRAMA
jgi:hypothetical protein